MIYYTGDTHGDVEKLYKFKERFGLTADDTIVIHSGASTMFQYAVRKDKDTIQYSRIEST